MISWVNNRYSYNIPKYSIDNSDLKTNGWLAGFIDADGGFKIRYTEKRIDDKTTKVLTKGKIELRFALEQRLSLKSTNKNQDNSYKPIMLKIQSFLLFVEILKLLGIIWIKKYWLIEVTILSKLKFLIQYLKTYPLLTAKRNDYEDWLKTYLLIEEKTFNWKWKIVN